MSDDELLAGVLRRFLNDADIYVFGCWHKNGSELGIDGKLWDLTDDELGAINRNIRTRKTG